MNHSKLFTYLESISAQGSHDTPLAVALNIAVVFVLMLFVLLVYRVVHNRNLSFSANFGFVILLTGLVTGVIMMTIENNLVLSLGMVGALSIVRYRSAIKDPKDTGFIFWAVAEGLCAGTGNYVLALVGALLIGAAVIVYSIVFRVQAMHLLVVRASGDCYDEVVACFKENKIKYAIKLKNAADTYCEYIFKINARNREDIVEKLKTIENVGSVSLAFDGEQ